MLFYWINGTISLLHWTDTLNVVPFLLKSLRRKRILMILQDYDKFTTPILYECMSSVQCNLNRLLFYEKCLLFPLKPIYKNSKMRRMKMSYYMPFDGQELARGPKYP